MTGEGTGELSEEEQANLWLVRDAGRLGLTFWEYCRKFGITGEAQKRRIRRHESSNMNGILYPEAYDPGAAGR